MIFFKICFTDSVNSNLAIRKADFGGGEMIEKRFEPGTIKGIRLKNRLVRSATAEGMATFDGYPGARVD